MFDPETRDSYAHDAVIAVLPDEVHAAINGCEAFEAFAVTLARTASDDPATMGKILDDVTTALPEGRLEWVIANTDVPPAAYLQKRIAEYTADLEGEPVTGTEPTLGQQARDLVEEHSEIGVPDQLRDSDTFERVLVKLGEYLAKMPDTLNRDRLDLEATLGWIGTAFGDVMSEDTDRAEEDPNGPQVPPPGL